MLNNRTVHLCKDDTAPRMAALARDPRIPIGTTIADIEISVRVALLLWIPSTDATNTRVAVVVARGVRNFDITKPAPTPIGWLRYEINPGILETADIYPMNPNI